MNAIEKKYVYDTYSKIAHSFSNTRSYIWPSVKLFLDNLDVGSIILEVGCGNGKNLDYRKDCFNIGLDLCTEFCEITSQKQIDAIIANNTALALRTNSVDVVLSIAVIHHLSTSVGRLNAIKELIRVLKPGGKLLIQVWALEQPEKSKRRFTDGDNFVEFKSKDGTICEKRYYYIFNEEKFRNLFSTIDNIKIIELFLEHGNWVIELQKMIVL